ncbi:MAG: NfeD family protein [Lachnospiraceae bacterium]
MEAYIWLIIMVAFLVIEAATAGLATIWFAIGALVAMIANLMGFGIVSQFASFIIVSLLMLAFTRPIALKYLNPKKIKTNYEDAEGKTVKITERVDNDNETGKAILNGQEWTVKSWKDDVILEKESMAKVQEVKGVKLIVKPEQE